MSNIQDGGTPIGQPEMRITEPEKEVIRNHFKGNVNLLKLLRKIFLPEYDPEAPLGQTMDLWMTINLENMTPENAMIQIHARNSLIIHVETQLMQLQALAEMPADNKETIEERREKDSVK